jgi:hypothetical protein
MKRDSMPVEDFVKYMTQAKGIFYSLYNCPIRNIQVEENNKDVISFLIESEKPLTGGKYKVVIPIKKDKKI